MTVDRCEYRDRHPAIDGELKELFRRVEELEGALRREGGIYDVLKRLEVQLASLSASVRTGVAIGTLAGSAIGGLITLGVQLLLRGH